MSCFGVLLVVFAVAICLASASLCGGTFRGSGTISSPGYPNSYPDNANCTWILHGHLNGDGILLEFRSLLTEPKNDYVRVSDGRTKISYDGSLSSNLVLRLGISVVVTFTSDSSISDEGFSAYFETVSTGSLCGGTFWGSGTISSPGYPNSYPNNANCTWILNANSTGPGMLLQFRFLQTERGYDIVSVRDGRTKLSYNGSLSSYPVIRLGRSVVVTFTSDSSQTYAGFIAHFATVFSATRSLCGETFWGSGTISSPGYPNSYPDNANCTWILNANASGDGILLEFTYFSTEPGKALVHVSDGTMQFRYDGSLSSTPVLSLGRRVVVAFTSDSSKTDAGFSAQFATVSNRSLCGGAFWGSGTISSPGYPNGYPQYADCTWILNADAIGDGILLDFTYFLTNKFHEFVYVSDGSALLRYSGSLPSNHVLRLGRRVVVRFTNDIQDYSSEKRGFSARFTTVYVTTEATATISTAIIGAIAASGSVIIIASVIFMSWLRKRKLCLWQAERKANWTDAKETPAESLPHLINGSGAGNDERVHEFRMYAKAPGTNASPRMPSEIIFDESTYATTESQQFECIYENLQT